MSRTTEKNIIQRMTVNCRPEEHDKRAARKISSSVMLASVADVGSHNGHPQQPNRACIS